MRRLLTLTLMLVAIGGMAGRRLLAQQEQAQPPVSAADTNLRGFVVTLALGDVASGKTTGTFTPAALKAIADLKDFLPYKSYRVLDTVWMIGLNGPHQFLQGPDGQKHEFYMSSSTESPTRISVRMLRLWDVASAGHPPPTLIDTSLTLTVGETVVVGTSRVDSSTGLILLVTAAAR